MADAVADPLTGLAAAGAVTAALAAGGRWRLDAALPGGRGRGRDRRGRHLGARPARRGGGPRGAPPPRGERPTWGPTPAPFSPSSGSADRIVSVPPAPGPDPLPPRRAAAAGAHVGPGAAAQQLAALRLRLRVRERQGGVYLVDAGWNTDDAYQALEAGLAHAGYAMSDVQGVMVTHIHPDHYGLAGRIREASGAWISLHPADARLIQDRYVEPADLLERMGAMLRRNGAPAEEIAVLQNVAMPVRPLVDPVLPDILLEDGERPEVPVGTCPPSGRRGTPPATCASGSRPTSCC